MMVSRKFIFGFTTSTLSKDRANFLTSGNSKNVSKNTAFISGYISLAIYNSTVESLPPENETYTWSIPYLSTHCLILAFVIMTFCCRGICCKLRRSASVRPLSCFLNVIVHLFARTPTRPMVIEIEAIHTYLLPFSSRRSTMVSVRIYIMAETIRTISRHFFAINYQFRHVLPFPFPLTYQPACHNTSAALLLRIRILFRFLLHPLPMTYLQGIAGCSIVRFENHCSFWKFLINYSCVIVIIDICVNLTHVAHLHLCLRHIIVHGIKFQSIVLTEP